jgi:Tol biopolymer transport system component
VAREILADVREADWSPDGAEMAIVRRVDGKDRLEYPVGHVILETDHWLTDLHVSPKGDRFAFFEHFDLGDNRGTVVVLDKNGSRTVLGPEYSGLEGLAWSKDGREVLFTGGELGERLHLFRAAPGKMPVARLPVPGEIILHAISGTGQWLVTRESQPWRIWARPPGSDADRDFSWLDRSDASVISRDGRWVAFSDQGPQAGNRYATMLRKTDGSAAVRLGEGLPVEFSPDNRWILALVPTSPTHYELLPTAAGAPVRLDWPLLRNVEWHPDFFPDSRSLLVCGAETGHAERCYKSAIEGGALEPVTPDSIVTSPYIGGSQLSPDGTAIVVRSGGHAMVWRLDGGPPRTLPAIAPGDNVLRWSPDGKALWVAPVAVPIRIDKVDVATGGREPLVTITPPERANVFQLQWLSLADDPRVYAYNTGSWSSELYLVEGTE